MLRTITSISGLAKRVRSQPGNIAEGVVQYRYQTWKGLM